MNLIRLKQQDWIYNAGLVGFVNILNHHKEDSVVVNKHSIEFDITELNNFEEKYFNYYIYKYEKFMNLYTVLNYKDTILRLKNEITEEGYEEQLNLFNEIVKDVKEKVSSNSYKRVYSLLGKEKEFTPLIKELKTVTKSKKESFSVLEEKIEKQVEVITELIDMLSDEELKYLINIQLIKFNIINKMLSNASFLNKQFKGNDVVEYGDYFTHSTKEYLHADKDKYKYSCICCDSKIKGINKPYSFTLTWINKVGVDETRKSSHFWDCNPNAYVCPMCNLIFSCIPLGFNFLLNKGIFLNQNSNLLDLIDLNKPIFHKYLNNSKKEIDKEIKSRELDTLLLDQFSDIQIITLDTSNDNFNINFNLLNYQQVKFIRNNKNRLQSLINKNIKDESNDTFINLYEEVLKHIINNKSMFKFLLYLNKITNSHNYELENILILNTNYLGEMRMDNKTLNQNMIYVAKNKGLELKRHYAYLNSTNKINSGVHKIITALKGKNKSKFIETLMHLHIYVGREIPSIFIECLKDDESLEVLGYAFLLGLQSEDYSKKDKEKEKEEK